MGKILNYSTAVVRDYETAKSWLEKEQETDNQAGVTSFLVKERVVRERI